eukprot:734775-Amorphochlora_amoeboformis.AAC.1
MVQRLRREFKLNVRGLGARSTREHYDVILKELREGQLDMLIATDFLARVGERRRGGEEGRERERGREGYRERGGYRER